MYFSINIFYSSSVSVDYALDYFKRLGFQWRIVIVNEVFQRGPVAYRDMFKIRITAFETFKIVAFGKIQTFPAS